MLELTTYIDYPGGFMNHTMIKTVAGLSVILASTFLLSACNTLQNTESGIKQTAYGVDQTVEGAAVGAKQDIKAVTKKSTSKNQMMGDSNHEPAG